MTHFIIKLTFNYNHMGQVSVLSVETHYGLDKSRDQILVGVRFSTPFQTGPWAQPASCIMGSRSLSQG